MSRALSSARTPHSGSAGRPSWPLLLGVAASAAAITAAGALALHLRRRRAARATAARYGGLDPAHSMPLPAAPYIPLRDYSAYDLLVLFPSTVAEEADKHYARMAAEGLPGAEAVLLAPQDAQKKACTYGLDDSETELRVSLELLRPRSLRFLHVSLDSYKQLFASYTPEQRARTLVLNLCDGTELDGIPGLSVLKHLRDVGGAEAASAAVAGAAVASAPRGVPFTGASEDFFVVSTYKQRMKALFDARGVETAPWTRLPSELLAEWREARAVEGKPVRLYDPEQDAAAAQQLQTQTSEQREHPAPNPCSLEASFSPALSALLARVRSLPFPVLVKPDDSYCSCGITTRSVCFQPEDALDYAASIAPQFTGVLVEQFVRGREFTVLVAGAPRKDGPAEEENRGGEKDTEAALAAGAPLPPLTTRDLSSLHDAGLRSYAPVERVFDTSLPFFERFISYELFWEISRAATELGKDEFVFKPVPSEERTTRLRAADSTAPAAPGGPDAPLREESLPLSVALQEEALKAYLSVGGSGYARVDIRLDEGDAAASPPRRPRIQVLEVNANCGITQYKQTAMGEILRESGTTFAELLDSFFDDAIRRFEQQAQ